MAWLGRRERMVVLVYGLALAAVAASVAVVLIGILFPGRVPAARGRAVALRVEPLAKAQRLAPVGLPSLTRTRLGRRCRLRHAAALSRARGSRALFPSRCA